MRTTINKNARATLGSIWHTIRENQDGPDLGMAASRILRKQKPLMVKRTVSPFPLL